jgi:hypothetical protein
MSMCASPKLEVGMGATILGWTDRKAVTIVAVSKSGRRIMVQRDKAIRVDANGMSEAQDYRYEQDKDGRTEEYSLRKDGAWRPVGGSSGQLFIGERDEYYDYSF